MVQHLGQDDVGYVRRHHGGMPLPSPKPKLTPEDHRVRQADRLATNRLRMVIWSALDERQITAAAIGKALGMPPVEAAKLLTGGRWREDNVARLEAAAARLGVEVSGL